MKGYVLYRRNRSTGKSCSCLFLLEVHCQHKCPQQLPLLSWTTYRLMWYWDKNVSFLWRWVYKWLLDAHCFLESSDFSVSSFIWGAWGGGVGKVPGLELKVFLVLNICCADNHTLSTMHLSDIYSSYLQNRWCQRASQLMFWGPFPSLMHTDMSTLCQGHWWIYICVFPRSQDLWITINFQVLNVSSVAI